jgi:hypothetical protein
MFSQDRGATASYRMLARGFGGSWAQTYKAAQQQCGVRQQLHQTPAAGAVVPGQRGAAVASSSGQGRA